MKNHLLSLSSLFLGIVLLLTGHGLQLSLLPLRAEVLGWTSMQVGWTSSIYFAGFLLGCLTIPRLVGAVGHVRVFAVLSATMTVSLLVLSATNEFAAWMALRLLNGWSIAGIYLVVESWLNEEAEQNQRGRLLSFYTITVLLAMAAGQGLLNVAPPTSYEVLVLAAVLVALAAVPVGLTRIPQPQPVPNATFSPWVALSRSRAAAVASLTSGLVTGCYYGLGPFYGKSIGLDVGSISLMMAAGIIGGALMQWPLGRMSDSLDRRLVLCGAMTLGLISCLVALRLQPAWLPYLMFFFGAGAMPLYALALAHAGDNVSSSFLEVGTGVLITNGAGAIVGPLAASAAMAVWGPKAFFVFCGIVLALGATAMVIFVRDRPALKPHFSPFSPATTASAQGAIELDPRSERD